MEQNVLGIKVQALYWCILDDSFIMTIHTCTYIFIIGNQFYFLPIFPKQSPLTSFFVCVRDSVIHQSIPKQLPFRSIQLPRIVFLNLWVTTLAGGSPETIGKYIFCGLRNCDTSALSISRRVQPHTCQVY